MTTERDEAKRVRVSAEGTQILRPVATHAGDSITCDCANWANARLIRSPDATLPASETLDLAPFGSVVTRDPPPLDHEKRGPWLLHWRDPVAFQGRNCCWHEFGIPGATRREAQHTGPAVQQDIQVDTRFVSCPIPGVNEDDRAMHLLDEWFQANKGGNVYLCDPTKEEKGGYCANVAVCLCREQGWAAKCPPWQGWP